MIWQNLLTAFTLLSPCISLRVPGSHSLHEERVDTPSRWVKKDKVPPAARFQVRVGLAQQNLDRVHDLLMDVSDPESENYGKHWSADEVTEAFQPSMETVDLVKDWLTTSGISASRLTHSDNKGWFAFHASVEEMESLLHTEYHEYQDTQTGGIMPACEQYHIPSHLQPHVDYITPGIKLLAPLEKPKPYQKQSLAKRLTTPNEPSDHQPKISFLHDPTVEMPENAATNLSNCASLLTPACIAALYDIPHGRSACKDNSMGIFESELEFWDQKDLNLFFANFTKRIPKGTHPIDKLIDGAVAETKKPSEAGGEALLDLAIAYPIVYPQTITVWNTDDLHYQAWLNDTYDWGFNSFLDAIDGSYCSYCAYGECGNAPGIDPTYPDPTNPGGYNGTYQCGGFKSTNVVSFSYAGQEADVPIAYQKRQCNEFAKLGLQGISFLFASGDAGVGNYPKPYGDGCLGPKDNIFSPTWPGTCPYITSVGATKVYKTVFDPESVAYDPAGHPYAVNYSSGGGFSNIFPPAKYQKAALSHYFTEHDPKYPYYSALAPNAKNPTKLHAAKLAGNTGGVYNRLGRGLPDVSANGDAGALYLGGQLITSGGTSQATPLFASVINRLNEERLLAGKSVLGFLNPMLYAHPHILNDIKNGSNPNCGAHGFRAVEGWDPSSGLGTPNYPKMLELVLSLP